MLHQFIYEIVSVFKELHLEIRQFTLHKYFHLIFVKSYDVDCLLFIFEHLWAVHFADELFHAQACVDVFEIV